MDQPEDYTLSVSAYNVMGRWHASLVVRRMGEDGLPDTQTILRIDRGLLRMDEPVSQAWAILSRMVRDLEVEHASRTS
jgi:hypothetical protein